MPGLGIEYGLTCLGARKVCGDGRMSTSTAEEAEVQDGAPETQDGPLLDMSDAGVKRMIKLAKQRGYVTYDELNEVLPSEEVSSEQIEDIMAMLNDMGINVVENEDETEDGLEAADRPDAALPMKRERAASDPVERTDDPVRMYLREMGSVELLSREGEIAIAKRIEAGREAMIAGLCESPLTFKNYFRITLAMDWFQRCHADGSC